MKEIRFQSLYFDVRGYPAYICGVCWKLLGPFKNAANFSGKMDQNGKVPEKTHWITSHDDTCIMHAGCQLCDRDSLKPLSRMKMKPMWIKAWQRIWMDVDNIFPQRIESAKLIVRIHHATSAIWRVGDQKNNKRIKKKYSQGIKKSLWTSQKIIHVDRNAFVWKGSKNCLTDRIKKNY